MAERERLRLSDGASVTCDFEVLGLDATFHPAPCVYAVIRRRQDGANEVIFIGETSSMVEHVRDHPNAACFIQRGATSIGMHREENAKRRREKTKALIATLRPLCNR